MDVNARKPVLTVVVIAHEKTTTLSSLCPASWSTQRPERMKRTRGYFSNSKAMRLNFGSVPSFEEITALTYSAFGKSKNPDSTRFVPCLWYSILLLSTLERLVGPRHDDGVRRIEIS
jgi:hypothetical protein